MKYNPNDYDPAAEVMHDLVPEGDYEFTVSNAFERLSHNGNEMIELELSVEVGRDQPIRVYDRLVGTPAAQWKIHQFCECVGLEYNQGEVLPDDVAGRSGWAHFVQGEPRQAGRSMGKRFLEVGYYRRNMPQGQVSAPPRDGRSRRGEPVQSAPTAPAGRNMPSEQEGAASESGSRQPQPAKNPDLSELPF